MSNSTITCIRKRLADQISGAVGKSINVSWFPGSGRPVPLIEIDEAVDSIEYLPQIGSAGKAVLRFTLTVLLDGRSGESVVADMDDLLSWDSPRSLYAAVSADRTLGGLVDEALVLTAERFVGEPARAELPVEIKVRKS